MEISVLARRSKSLVPLLAATAILAMLPGCGSSTSPMTNGSPPSSSFSSPGGSNPGGSGSSGSPSGGSNSGGSGSGGSGSPSPTQASSLAACGTKNATTYTITGKIVDAATGQPINGSAFVWIDYPDGTAINQVKAGSDGTFQSAQLVLSQTSFALVFGGISSDGTAYIPAVLIPTSGCNISQGSFIGTVDLSRGSGAQITAMATATTAQGQPALVRAYPGLIEQANGVNWGVPWLSAYPAPTTDLTTGTSCPANTACATFETVVSAEALQVATYNGSNTIFAASPGAASYSLQIVWQPGTTFFGQCTPLSQTLGPMTTTPGTTVDFGTASFTAC